MFNGRAMIENDLDALALDYGDGALGADLYPEDIYEREDTLHVNAYVIDDPLGGYLQVAEDDTTGAVVWAVKVDDLGLALESVR